MSPSTSTSELEKRIVQVEELLTSLIEAKDRAKSEQYNQAKVEPWEFGARVVLKDGKSEVLSLPPKVGRYPIDIYNQVIDQINLNSNALLFS